MKKTKRLLALILVVVLCVTISPRHSWATENSVNEEKTLSLLSQSNYEKLCLHIDQNGIADSSGFKYMKIKEYTYSSGETYSVFIKNKGNSIIFTLDMEASSVRATMDVIVDSSSIDVTVDHSIFMTNNDTVVNALSIDRTLHSYYSEYTVNNGNGYVNLDAVSQLFSSSIQLLCLEVDEYLYENLDFGLYGLDFEKYYHNDELCDEHQYGLLISDAKYVHYNTCSGCHISDWEEHSWIVDGDEKTCEVCGRVEINKAAVETPDKPELVEYTASTVTLRKISGYEYSKDGKSWQESNVFTGLNNSTKYLFYQRLKETDTTLASDASTPLEVKTTEKSDCSIKPAAPIVQSYSYDKIVLVKRDGYEYKLNNGLWTNNNTFTGLSENTSYTVYQRVAESEEEYASDASTGVTVKTASKGTSTLTNYDKLREYIDLYGTTSSNGNKRIAMYTDMGNYREYVSMENKTGGIYFSEWTELDTVSGVKFQTGFLLTKNSDTITVNHSETLISNGSTIERVEGTKYLDRSTYSASNTYTFYESGKYITANDFSKNFNLAMKYLSGHWDIFIYGKLGFGLKGLGFLSFSGNGTTVCNPLSSYHKGQTEIRNARSATCTIDGYTGDTYCTSCGEMVRSGSPITCVGYHEYEEACDKDCNICGEERRVKHTYSFGCDEECNECDTTRNTYMEHFFNTAGVCINCGAVNSIPGDVNGDKKINSLDGLMLLRYLNGWDVNIASPDAMDVNNDGKVNSLDGLILRRYLNGWNVTLK